MLVKLLSKENESVCAVKCNNKNNPAVNLAYVFKTQSNVMAKQERYLAVISSPALDLC